MSSSDRLNERRIVWLSHSFGYSGDLIYFAPLLRGFVSAFPNTVIPVDEPTLNKNPDFGSWFRLLHFHTIRIRRRVRGVGYETDVRLPSVRLCSLLLRAKPELTIVVEFTPISICGMLISKLFSRSRLLLLVESDPSFRGAPGGRLLLALKGFLARCADLVMTNNKLGERYLLDVLNVPANKIRTAPYLTSEVKSNSNLEASAWNEPVEFLFLNSLTDRKGVMTLLQSLLLLTVAVRNRIRLRIVGDGPLQTQVTNFIELKNLSDTVELVGKVSYTEIGRELARAHVYILPTLGDYRSLGGFEALSAGLPVLISRYDGAHSELVEEGVNGFIIDPLNIDDLAQKITWFVEKHGNIPAMGAASRRLAEQFRISTVVDNLTCAVCDALGE